MRREYEAPKVTSVQLEDPMAFACNVYNASSLAGTWSGPGLTTNPNLVC